MDIDRLILSVEVIGAAPRFGSLMDIDRLIRNSNFPHWKVL